MQDFDLAIAQIESDKQAAASSEHLMRELNHNIVNVMGSIEGRLGDISKKLESIGQYIRSDSNNIQISDKTILFKDSAILASFWNRDFKINPRNTDYQFMINVITSMTDSFLPRNKSQVMTRSQYERLIIAILILFIEKLE